MLSMRTSRILQIIFAVIIIAAVVFKLGFFVSLIGGVGLIGATLWGNKTGK